MSTNRIARVERTTNETSIVLALNLDGQGKNSISTGFGFADHMLDLLAHWAGFDLEIACTGDVHIDAHHSIEDIGLCLGQALAEALGDKKGIARVGWAHVPMDEALADVCLDLSGRAYLVYRGDDLLPPLIAGEEIDLWREFLKSVAFRGQFNLHVSYAYGLNGHHLLESAFKGIGRALKQAVLRSGSAEVLSTKGSLDQ